MRATGASGLGLVGAVVDVLTQAGFANDLRMRSLLVRTVAGELALPFIVPDQASGRDHLIEIVRACMRSEQGMAVLVQVLAVMRPKSPEYHAVRRLVGDRPVLDLMSAAELSELKKKLTGRVVPDLPLLVRRAAGISAQNVWRGTDAWQAVWHLADVNAGVDGMPPAMILLELIAARVGGELSEQLMACNDDLALRLNLGSELHAARTDAGSPTARRARLHLVIAISHDAIDPRLYTVCSWRQDDPEEWPPPRGETHTMEYSLLEQGIDDLVTAAEIAWAMRERPVALEFVLPRSLLNLPVHLWQKEHDSGDPLPLFIEYPVVIRSLERMRLQQWHRVWRRRWKAMMENPAAARVHFGLWEGRQGLHQVDTVLGDPGWVLMVLSGPPPVQAQPGADELTAALRSGLPALVWDRAGRSAEAIHDIVVWLTEGSGLGDLPVRAQEARKAGFLQAQLTFDADIARDLVVLWDDPHRLVIVD